LADGALGVFCISGNSYRYLKLSAAAAGATTVSGWWTMNKQ
jgi:hypothetical protein